MLKDRDNHHCPAIIVVEPTSNTPMLTFYHDLKVLPHGVNASDLQRAETIFGQKIVAGVFPVEVILTSRTGQIELQIEWRNMLQLRQITEALLNVPKQE